jgi:hypothetical protein
MPVAKEIPATGIFYAKYFHPFRRMLLGAGCTGIRQTKKVNQRIQIAVRCSQITQSMVCAGYNHQLLPGSTGGIVFHAHFAGDESVFIAMEKHDGDGTRLHCLHGRGFL